MRKKIILFSILLITAILIIAVFTKPSDKKIMIEVIDKVWGDRVPDKYTDSRYYEQFMNATTPAIIIDDWIFLKRIKYTIKDKTPTIGFAAFGKVFLVDDISPFVAGILKGNDFL